MPEPAAVVGEPKEAKDDEINRRKNHKRGNHVRRIHRIAVSERKPAAGSESQDDRYRPIGYSWFLRHPATLAVRTLAFQALFEIGALSEADP